MDGATPHLNVYEGTPLALCLLSGSSRLQCTSMKMANMTNHTNMSIMPELDGNIAQAIDP